VKAVAGAIGGGVPFIVGASADDAETCCSFAKLAGKVKAAAYLVAEPNARYGRTEEPLSFFRSIVVASSAPIIIQDLQWNGPGLDLDSIRRLPDELPTLAGLKIETVPAGAKYTRVRETFGPDLPSTALSWFMPRLFTMLGTIRAAMEITKSGTKWSLYGLRI